MTTSEDPKSSGAVTEPRRGVMQSLTGLCVRYVERLMPDPYLFAIILTLIVAVLVAVLVNGASAGDILKAWYGGVRGSQNIFTFAFQMVLILVTGYTLAEAPILKRAIVGIASKPRNQVQGALLCFGVSAVLSLLNWAGAGGRCIGRPSGRQAFCGRAFRLSGRGGVHGFHRLDAGPVVVDRAGQHRQRQPDQRDPQAGPRHGTVESDHFSDLQLVVGDHRADAARAGDLADGTRRESRARPRRLRGRRPVGG